MNNSNVFPFLWVRDEPVEKIYREIDAIKNLTDGFIIESRPRRGEISDFGTEKWFIRIGKILAYANNLNMRVWILDDKSFPTGFANGAILEKYPELKAKQ
ncbi:MAG: glycoside hydrolase family 2, partial [Clostridia bacterium]|nr:glycoside hydrolase family 2 [Clostridia bacterium]